ncbi:15629_t:CDS:2 [Entrophospora sp. SA101]|nr:15629_t:CDS:2 [Entrophospora sp. SA101]
MSNSNSNQIPISEEIKSPTPFTFALTCPHCQKSLTAQDFDNNHFTIAHLQSYFQHKETEYKQQIRQQLEQEITSLPIFQQLKSENEKLKLIVEGYKLGSTKNSKTKGEELEKYILEQLQTKKLEKDMVNEKADYGIIIATCRQGNPL